MNIDITWVDEFVGSIATHVYVRERDNLLILMPNQAYKLNHTGLVLLKRILDGASIVDVLESKSPDLSKDPEVIQDVHDFFCDVRALVMGCLGEGAGRKAIEHIPFERPFNSLPVLSEVALTYRCNLSCKFCYAGCTCKKQPKQVEMTTEQVKKVLDVIRNDADVPSISWTGGEPTVRTDLVELTRYASSLGMRVNLITNGTNLNDALVAELKDAGLRSAQVSLEGPTPEVHDALTQVKGSFDRTIRGIQSLKAAGIHVHTNTTVNKMNSSHLVELLSTVKGLGMDRCSMNMVVPCGSAPDESVTITYTEMAELVEVIRLAARREEIRFLWYSPTPYCIYNPVAARLGGKSCAACDGLLSVAPNGDVLPCSSLPKSVGNVLTDSFDSIWSGRKAKYWRDKRYAHKICRGCEQFTLCSGACPIYWKAMGYKELKDNWRRVSSCERIA